MTDINGAVKIAASFGDAPAVCIIKHANPCGFAIGGDLLDSYIKALKCDPVSAYGGVVAINGTLNKALAEKINEIFVEVIIAANVDEDALHVFDSKNASKSLRKRANTLFSAKMRRISNTLMAGLFSKRATW